jgi:transposase
MRYELTDHEWAAIRPMLPNKPISPQSVEIRPWSRRPQAAARDCNAPRLSQHLRTLQNDLDVKGIVNLWAGKLRGSEVNAGRCWNECANARDYLCLAWRHGEPGWL